MYAAKRINTVEEKLHSKLQNEFCSPFLPFHVVFAGSIGEHSSTCASAKLYHADMSQKYGIVEAFCNSGIFCFVIEIN